MPQYRLTVGQKYREEEHPQGLHPDGWVTINADDYDKAREKAFQNFGPKWAFIYDVDGLDDKMFPRGELMVIS